MAAAASWTSVLRSTTREEIDLRARFEPAKRRLERVAPRVAAELSRAAAGLWPTAPASDFRMRIAIRTAEQPRREHELCRLPIRIGRGDGSEIQLPDRSVSTEHAEIRLEGEDLVIVDRKSLNGTRANGEALAPLTPRKITAGDVIAAGPFEIDVLEALRGAEALDPRLELRARALRPWRQSRPFARLGHASDRWIRIEWAGESGWLRVPAAWIRACWRRVADSTAALDGDVEPIEEGAAQYVLLRIAGALGQSTGTPLQTSGWLRPGEADALESEIADWLVGDLEVAADGAVFASTFLAAVPAELPGSGEIALENLPFPASVDVGVVHLAPREWRELRPGDAFFPDRWIADGWVGEGDRDVGRVCVRVGRFSHRGTLKLEGGTPKVTLDECWLDRPEGDWSMANDEAPQDAPEEAPGAVSVDELAMQVVIELDRVAVTVATLRTWKPGEILSLARAADDPVRLVVETGMHRRVLAEGRVVVVDGKLAIEIGRVIAPLEPAKS